MISAATVNPAVDFKLPPSPASRTSPSVILSPALPSSFSTTILSPGCTRYCFPPVRMTANMAFSSSNSRGPRAWRLDKRLQARGSAPPMAGALECQPLELLAELIAQAIAAALQPLEHHFDRGMLDRLVGLVGHQVLLADVGDVGGFRIL